MSSPAVVIRFLLFHFVIIGVLIFINVFYHLGFEIETLIATWTNMILYILALPLYKKAAESKDGKGALMLLGQMTARFLFLLFLILVLAFIYKQRDNFVAFSYLSVAMAGHFTISLIVEALAWARLNKAEKKKV